MTDEMNNDDDNRSSILDETYEQLRVLASNYLRAESVTATLSPTVLVHEAFLKLSSQRNAQFESRSHFLALAATTMRRILVDHARAKSRLKRGKGFIRIDLNHKDIELSLRRNQDVLALESALEELQRLDERQARIVEMRFFSGMTNAEVAEVLGLSIRTIEKEWAMCRAWLRAQLEESNSIDSGDA